MTLTYIVFVSHDASPSAFNLHLEWLVSFLFFVVLLQLLSNCPIIGNSLIW